jgi:hypothetical protein
VVQLLLLFYSRNSCNSRLASFVGEIHGMQKAQQRVILHLHQYRLPDQGSVLRVPRQAPGQEAIARLLLLAGGREDLRPQLREFRQNLEALRSTAFDCRFSIEKRRPSRTISSRDRKNGNCRLAIATLDATL